MKLTRKHKTRQLSNLPLLKANHFLYNGQKGYTGSLIRRPVKGTAGLYKHTGLIYGYDHSNTLWIIENNINGVECITFQDFALDKGTIVELNTNPILIETIMSRAHEKSKDRYHARSNNCEHFTNYCLTGVHFSDQSNNTEAFADVGLMLLEAYSIVSSMPPSILENFSKIRKSLKLERSEEAQKVINELLKRKLALEPPLKITRKRKVTKKPMKEKS